MISKSVVEAKFSRANIKTKETFLWSDVPLDSELPLNLVGEPILYHHSSGNYLWILTLQMVYIKDKGERIFIPYSDINSMSLEGLFSGLVDNYTNDRIGIVKKDNSTLDLKVEPSCWFVVYKILKLLLYQYKDV